MNSFGQDVRFAIRTLLKSPGFTVIAIATLALGIGANSAIFSFVNGVLLKPLSYSEPDRLMRVWEKAPAYLRTGSSTLNFLDWKESNDVFENISASTGSVMTLSGQGEPVQIPTGRVSASYFDIFRVHAVLGRTFAPNEDQPGKEKVLVLSHALWVSRFGQDAGIIGRKLTLDGELYTVIGVLPGGGAFDRTYGQMWRPLAFQAEERTRDFHWFYTYARLKPGISLEQARRAMDVIGARIAADHPDSNKGWGVYVEPYGDTLIPPQVRQSLYVLISAVAALLLIGCANLANLVLARGTTREREVAIRAAMGAGRSRLIRQFLTESVVLSLAGGLAGLGLGYVLMAGIEKLIPPYSLPAEVNITMDTRVLTFALALSMITGLIFGIAPALQGTKPDLAKAMKEGGRGTSGDSRRVRLRGVLVVAEVAIAFVLISSTGLLVRSFFHLLDVDTGFDSTNVLTANLPVPSNSKLADSERMTEYAREIVTRLDATPGVSESAVTSVLPMQGWAMGMPYLVDGREIVDRANRKVAAFKTIGSAYFHTLGMKLIKGRGFTDQDVKGAPPAMVINQTMAKRIFDKQEPIGQRILVQEIVPGKPQLGPEIPWEIVGVVGDELVSSPDSDASDVMYVPFDQSPVTLLNLVIRSSVNAASIQQSLVQAIHDVNKDQAVSKVQTLEKIKGDSMASNRLRTMLLGIFAALALLLSGAGIYGVLSYSVVQRTHEIGIRAALGAGSGTVLRMILSNGMSLTIIGLIIGAAGGAGLTRLLQGLLFGVTAHDPLTMITAAFTLSVVALLACCIPAIRASRLDPLSAIRE